MSLDSKEAQCQYMAQQISFLRQAQSDWTSGLADYTNKIIHEIETWIHNSTPSTTFVEIAQLAQRAVIFITDKQATLSNNQEPNSSRNAAETLSDKTNYKNFVNLQSRVESLEEIVSSIRTAIKTGTIRRENENSDSENQAKQNKDLKAMELLITTTDQKLSSNLQNLEDTLQRQNTQLSSQLERLESDFSQYKCKELKDGQDHWTKLTNLETKYTLLNQLMLKKITSLEHLKNCLNLKLGQKEDCQNQFDQLKTDFDTVSRSVSELKSAHDALSTKIAETWPPHPHMPPPFMPPPPPHPFHHDHHHRRHHHRHC
ncbi:uncharacterized protein LOC106078272 isoform X2 [Biomphalaria glabrata]|uniref:Uncharacterized protein LOC106078272 isoform X2 n=1 Tax=Biomphalaria glabrata TaxID=6526 RepID=A0A9W2ZFN2_BIOGL|nr:uncharacterized protein LOC106078272 isoform X2 [Biomphalaria glabrata]